MKLKKLLTFFMTGVMIVSVPVIAGVGIGDSVLVVYAEDEESTSDGDGSGSGSSGSSSSGSSSSGSSSSGSSSSSSTPTYDPTPVKSEAQIEAERIAEEAAEAAREKERIAAQAARESEAFAQAIEASGVSMSTYVQAVAENKSVGEYMNNAVTEVPGLENATPVGQGGKVMIDGVLTNNTFSVQKPLLAHVKSAQSAALGGDILNVVDVKGAVSFETATVNFYMPGVTAEQDIQVYQLKDGTWSSVTVSEIREDHVVIDMDSYGIFAFVNVPGGGSKRITSSYGYRFGVG